MNLTTEQLEQELNRQLVGKRFDAWCTGSDVFKVIKDLLPEANPSGQYNLSYDQKRQEVTISYKRNVFAYVNVSKKQGKYNRGYIGSGYYDWTISKVSVTIPSHTTDESTLNMDTDKAIKQIEAIVVSENLARAAREDKDAEVFKVIMKHFGVSKSDAAWLLESAYKNRYNDRVEALIKEAE